MSYTLVPALLDLVKCFDSAARSRKLTGSKIFCCCWGGRVEYKGNILIGPTCSHKEGTHNLRTDHTKTINS